MKNVFITSAFLIVLFASCNNNDSNSAPTELNLVTSSNTTGKLTYTKFIGNNANVKIIFGRLENFLIPEKLAFLEIKL